MHIEDINLLKNIEIIKEKIKNCIKECLCIENEEETADQLLMTLLEMEYHFDANLITSEKIKKFKDVAYWNWSADLEEIKDWETDLWK